MADLSTLQTWLSEAEAALHALATGALEVQVEHGDMRVTYSKAETSALTAYIARLQAQIAAAGGSTGTRRRGIVVDN